LRRFGIMRLSKLPDSPRIATWVTRYPAYQWTDEARVRPRRRRQCSPLNSRSAGRRSTSIFAAGTTSNAWPELSWRSRSLWRGSAQSANQTSTVWRAAYSRLTAKCVRIATLVVLVLMLIEHGCDFSKERLSTLSVMS